VTLYRSGEMTARILLLSCGLMAAAASISCREGRGGPPRDPAAARAESAAPAQPRADSVAQALEAELKRYPERYAAERFPLVGVAEVKELLDRKADVVIVDARDPLSYARGHLPGAASYPFGNWLEPGMPLPPRDRDLIVYCNNQDCPISRLWSEQAAQHGYTRVRHMKPGLAGWEAAGLPVERGSGS
jgi:rhodanese-related sulfurtransferase